MQRRFSRLWYVTALLLVAVLLGPDLTPAPARWQQLARELAKLVPLIVTAALLAGWLASSARAARMRSGLDQRPVRAVVLASLFGAVTPVCGITSAPLVGALLRQGIPVSAAMAFLVASPVTDPGMVLLTAGLLGWPFALGKLVASALLGLAAGAITAVIIRARPHTRWIRDDVGMDGFGPEPATARQRFYRESRATFLLILRWLTFALALEAVIRVFAGDAGYALLADVDSARAVPLAVLIGGPLYIEGYAALAPLRALMDMGLSAGAAMAFLISGAAISLYSAVAVWHLVRPVLFAVYLGVGLAGALLAGWATDAVIMSW